MQIKLQLYEKLNGLFLKSRRLTFIHEFNSMEIICEMILFSQYEMYSFAIGNHYSCGVWKIFVEIKILLHFSPLRPQPSTMFIGLDGDGNMLDTN